MPLEPYRRVLALPGVRPLLLVALFARIPITASVVTLTLHVVLGLGRGYGAAGLVAAVTTGGSALGPPLLGRLVDRRGLRSALILTTVAATLFWAALPFLPYPALLVAAFPAGVLALPVFTVVRQSIAALVPADRRRPAYALDSMSVEACYIVGPALAVAVATTISTTVAALLVCVTTVVAGVSLVLLDPPVRAPDEDEQGPAAPRRSLLRPALLALFVGTVGTTLVLGGTEVAIVAVLRHAGELRWASAVTAVWGACSMLGGFVHGTLRRTPSPLTLMVLLGLLTMPIGLAGSWWGLCLALVPAGLLCAPALAATADAISRAAPAAARGEAMGWYGSALTAGLALGAPLVGGVVDATGPQWGPAAAGATTVALSLLALAIRTATPALRPT